MTEISQTIKLPSQESAIAIAGSGETNLSLLSRQTGVKVVLRGQDLMLFGKEKAVRRTASIVASLKPFWETNKTITEPDILTAFQAVDTNRVEEYSELQKDVLAKTKKGELIRAKTFKQKQYIKAIQNHDITFGIGPAGTGKTFLAAVLAVKALLSDDCEKIILTRPAVEAGEKLGFLPGDLQQKVNPFLRPLYDALYEFIDSEKIPDLIERGKIEVARPKHHPRPIKNGVNSFGIWVKNGGNRRHHSN